MKEKISMDIWQDIVKTALVGTERQKLQFKPQNNQLGEIIKHFDNQDTEGSLLAAAGAISLYQKAGKLPKTGLPLKLETHEAEDFPYCNQDAAQYLSIMLAEKNVTILSEWLKLAASAQRYVPPNYLPELLSLGGKNQTLRDSILPVIGKRGYWLATQNPEWSYAVREDKETTWKKGSTQAKQFLLKKLREQDSNQALETLKQYWKKQNLQDRTALLQALETNLSMNDEAFLEDALNDKRKQVRDVAGDLLAKLPKSRLVGRMVERVSSLISFSKDGIKIKLPPECTTEMTRDGIDQSKYSSGLGEKACLLLQMLSCVPPSFWLKNGKKTPQELIQIVSGNEWENLLLEGWVSATIRSQDKTWSVALVECIPYKLNNGYLQNFKQMMRGLLEVLGSTQAQETILQILSANPDKPINKGNNIIYKLLTATSFYWESELSRTVLSSIRSLIIESKKYNFSFSNLINHCGNYMEPTLLNEATEILTPLIEENPDWNSLINEFLSRLRLRSHIREAFK